MERLGGGDPRAVGGYPLFARLGAGGMGRVYLTRSSAGRALALKTLRPEFALDPGFAERFAREIRNADRVRSPWTVAVVDFSPPGSRPPWLATEYVAAPSLGEWVAAHGPLPPAAVVALAVELCGALRTVHEAGLAHRDVKPSNVLLARRRPLLIDFGIARAAEDPRHTRTGGVIGSPGYLPPEQATAGVASEPGDLFALAAVLVHAATGHGPFQHPDERPSTPALLYRVVHEEADLGDVPDAVLPLVRACLAKDPRDRPTAQQAARLLPARRPGDWSAELPGLEADLLAREERAREALGVGPAPEPALSSSPYAPTVSAPAPSPPRQDPVPRPPYDRPAVHPVPSPAPYPGPFRPVAGQPARSLRHPAGIGAVLVVVALLVWLVARGSFGSGHKGPGSPPPSTSRPHSAAPGALPSSWIGTWVGTGPGDPSPASAATPRTDRFIVILTLTGGPTGTVVGGQVSNVDEVGTGANVGCTETLRLTQNRGTTMVFTAATSRLTQPGRPGGCPTGDAYTVTMTDSRTLTLGPGSQAAGSPARLTKQV